MVWSFLNLDALAKWLIKQYRDIILFCAGWKGRFNLEDTLFAGALVELLIASNLYDNSCYAVQASSVMWNAAKSDLFSFLKNSSHRKRLSKLNIDSDVHFCLKLNHTDKIPILKGDVLVVDNE